MPKGMELKRALREELRRVGFKKFPKCQTGSTGSPGELPPSALRALSQRGWPGMVDGARSKAARWRLARLHLVNLTPSACQPNAEHRDVPLMLLCLPSIRPL